MRNKQNKFKQVCLHFCVNILTQFLESVAGMKQSETKTIDINDKSCQTKIRFISSVIVGL